MIYLLFLVVEVGRSGRLVFIEKQILLFEDFAEPFILDFLKILGLDVFLGNSFDTTCGRAFVFGVFRWLLYDSLLAMDSIRFVILRNCLSDRWKLIFIFCGFEAMIWGRGRGFSWVGGGLNSRGQCLAEFVGGFAHARKERLQWIINKPITVWQNKCLSQNVILRALLSKCLCLLVGKTARGFIYKFK